MTAEDEAPTTNKWLVAIAAMLATIIEVLDVTIANVALPHMQASFSASVDEITWVLTSYLVSNGIVIPVTGWLSTLFGRKRFFIGSTLLFTTFSVLCGLAWNLQTMVVFRIIQGVGGAAMVPLSQAVLMEVFPPAQQGLAMALWGMGLMIAPILGPTIGGWLTDNYDWRWIFYINLPVGLLAAVLQGAFLPPDPQGKRVVKRIDYLGLALVVVLIGCAQIVLDRGERAEWFAATWVWVFSGLSLTALLVLVPWELRHPSPVVDLRLFRYPAFASASVIIAFLCFSLYGNLVAWPLYLQTLMGYPAWRAGLAMSPRGMSTMASMFLVGMIYGRVDTRWVLGIGTLCVAAGAWEMSHFTTEYGFWEMVAPTLVLGFGLGFTFVPLSATALAAVPPDRVGNASALFNLMRNTGGSVGIAVAGTLIIRRSQLHQAMLVEHVDATSPIAQAAIEAAGRIRQHAGVDPYTASQQGLGMIYRLVQREAAVLAFQDVFLVLAVVVLLLLPLILLLGKTRGRATAGGH
ncbi:MAG: transporter, family, multidrug resistance protein [Candidatus Binatota bacterium]|nr:transporter, family, multidrug resistance protein [Candidatus Binatota bacterium]